MTFQDKALQVVCDFVDDHLDVTDGPQDYEAFVVWFSKTLQNWKALVSTTLPDGMYYEVTYDGERKRAYLDAYKKFVNVAVDD
jgi:hypothetical protein